MITVKQLREMIAEYPDDTPVIMQKDDEGNGYRYMNGIEFNPVGHPESNYYNGEYDGECVRQSDIDGGWGEASDYPHLVAVAY
jgi:hypothetical protein